MKSYIIIVFTVLLFCAVWLTACKKENGPQEDISGLFKNTVWTGLIKYTNVELAGIAQPYSIAFNGNGSFEWMEFAGDYTGTYFVDNAEKKLTIQFTGASNARVTFTITPEKEFGIITPATSYPWEILNGRFNETAGQALDNTKWQFYYPGNPVAQQLSFNPDQKVSITLAMVVTQTLPYTRKNGTIRYSWPLGVRSSFLVLYPDNKIKCVERNKSTTDNYFVYELTKQ